LKPAIWPGALTPLTTLRSASGASICVKTPLFKEAMRVANYIIKLSYDLVRAIPVGCSSGRIGHVNRAKGVLGLRQSRDTQKQAKRNSRK
jgi:hypothetical protein